MFKEVDRLRKFERKKWLTEIMDEVGIDLTKDNLLIAPIGSGKLITQLMSLWVIKVRSIFIYAIILI